MGDYFNCENKQEMQNNFRRKSNLKVHRLSES